MAPKWQNLTAKTREKLYISIKIWWPRCPSSSPKGAGRRRGPHKLRSDHFLWTSSHQAAARRRVGPPPRSFFWKTSQTSWDHLGTNAEIHFTESPTWRFACVSQCCWSSWNNRPLVTHFGMQNLFFRTFIPAWEPQCPSSQGRKESDEQAAADKADYTVTGCNSKNHNVDSFQTFKTSS